MNVEEIARFAETKGLSLVGTGDFTHPIWLKELKQSLAPIPNTNLFEPARRNHPTSFMITGEVSTIFALDDKTRKIHHLILAPSFEVAGQINDVLSSHGDLSDDGRPTLDMTAAQLVEEILTICADIEVIPAHVWTPWFSTLGAFNGFDRVEECYQDMTKHLHALETGLSSDPGMNWRLSTLDRYTLISNSDCHSCWPWRIGREANVFELPQLTYSEIIEVLRTKDPDRFKFTVETDPAYGKYHWTGHRNCNVAMPPAKAMKYGNRCPVCRGKLTKGVEQRVEELADRRTGYRPPNAINYIHLLPLSEIIAAVLGTSSPSTREVWSIYQHLIVKFGNEYEVLMEAPKEEMSRIVDARIAEAVMKVRMGKAHVTPGYDGVYGVLCPFDNQTKAEEIIDIPQRSLTDWCSTK